MFMHREAVFYPRSCSPCSSARIGQSCLQVPPRAIPAKARAAPICDPQPARLGHLGPAGGRRDQRVQDWMQERADPHARERAFDIARQDHPEGISAAEATAEIEKVLNSIGDTCPECPPDS